MPEILGRLRPPRLAGAPASPAVGEMYYDTGANVLYWWNGTTWVSASGGGTSGGLTQVYTIADYTANPNENVVCAKASVATITLPQAPALGTVVQVTMIVNNDVIVTTQGSDQLQVGGRAYTAGRQFRGNQSLHTFVYMGDSTDQFNQYWYGFRGTPDLGYVTAGSNITAYGGQAIFCTATAGITVTIGTSTNKGMQGDRILLVAASGPITIAPATWLQDQNGATVAANLVLPKGQSAELYSGLDTWRITRWPLTQLVSALPASPADGQEIYYQADATNGVIWRLRYRAASASTYKWEYVGGPPLTTQIDTDQTFTEGSTYVNPATAGPDVTVPLAGDYTYQMSTNFYVATQTAVGGGQLGLSVGGALPGGQAFSITPLTSGVSATAAKNGLLTGLAASTLLRMQYNAATAIGGTAHVRFRSLQVTPVRVG